MEKVLKLYKYIDGVNDTAFPNVEQQVITSDFRYDVKRMGGAPMITCTIKHELCLDKLWADNVYTMFNGERFFIKQVPSSSYDNTDSRYKHEVELVSERIVLDNVYFYDVVDSGSIDDKPVSHSSKFTFFGTINEFASRLGESLKYSKVEYSVVVDEGISSEAKQVSFQDQFFSNAIQESYNTYNIPYYFVGKVIHFGYTDNVITRTFKYGQDESLLSIQKQNENFKVVNRVTGVGSADNIPYYYPNDREYDVDVKVGWMGDYEWDYSDDSLELKVSDIVIVDENKFDRNVSETDKIICYSYQWRRNSINGEIVNLSDLGVEIIRHEDGFPNSYWWFGKGRKRVSNYINPQTNLMPSIYRETSGYERFYNAVNNTYLIPNTDEYYDFDNQYVEGKPKEHIINFEDIKPTIKGITNANGFRIDMFQEFAYDLNDNDETDEEGNPVHPYFFAKLRKFDGEHGFNLFDHSIDEQEMVISMTSGSCGSCEWVIGVLEDSRKNPVQVDDNGKLKRDNEGNVIRSGTPQNKQNDTINNEVWIALHKDIDTFGVVVPNATSNYKPSINDTFVILHVDLPKAYILAAEKKLDEQLIAYMALNNSEKFNFSISFSRIFFAENPEILGQLNENARIQIEYDNTNYELYISSYSYSMASDKPLPEIKVELSDTLTVAQNALQTAINDVKSEILSTGVGSSDFLKQGLKYFIRKDRPDTARKEITFAGGLRTLEAVWSFLTGKGTLIKDGVIQTDRIEVRQSMTVMDLIINQLQGIAADYLFSDVGKVDSVTEIADRTYVLHIEKKTDFDFTTLGHGDILHMIVNDLYKGGGNYFSSWMRVLSVDTDANDVTVVLYDDDQVQGGANFAPVAGYNVARRGNVIVPDEGKTNERANYWMLSSREGRIQFLQNMFKPTIEDYNYALTLGKLPDIKAIRHLPVTPNKDVGLVAQTAIVENLYQFDYNGDIVPKIVDRGNWSLAVAQSESPYRFFDYEREYPDGETTYTVLEQHSVWHNGVRFRCLKDKTTEEPKWNSTDWAMMDEYELGMRFTSSEGNAFHAGKVDTEITPSVYLGNIDISDDIAVIDWIWTYELGEYNGRVLHLTNELMPPNWSRTNKAKFTCTAYVRKGEDDVTPVSNVVTI